ncbi:hypothetical protein KUTeg_016212 [Tegillarca granosa]|uniref:Uncharacterized protein n=1 Tax=Tegillarca granosa TaxID=220873 RepID=A0ABQ9EPY6_TEGGR|nr:hypothetical protein KUTeg_016212 [Tegillarca granosa]
MSDNFETVCNRKSKRQRRFTNHSIEPTPQTYYITFDSSSNETKTMSNPEQQNVFQYSLNVHDVQGIAAAVNDSLQSEIISTVNNVLEAHFKTLEINTLKQENEVLRSENNELKLCVDDLEQYGRRNAIRLSGIPEKSDENTDNIVIDIASKIGIQVRDDDISRSDRSGKPGQNRPRQILVKFTRYNLKRKFMKSRWELKKNASCKDVFINEDLTKRRQDLYSKARQL